MLETREKIEALRLVSENRTTTPIRAILSLIEDEIENIRIDNDTADKDMIPINQGKITGLKKIKDYIIKDVVIDEDFLEK